MTMYTHNHVYCTTSAILSQSRKLNYSKVILQRNLVYLTKLKVKLKFKTRCLKRYIKKIIKSNIHCLSILIYLSEVWKFKFKTIKSIANR